MEFSYYLDEYIMALNDLESGVSKSTPSVNVLEYKAKHVEYCKSKLNNFVEQIRSGKDAA